MTQTIKEAEINVLVIYQSIYGNTRLIAESLAKGLTNSGIKTDLLNFQEINLKNLEKYDLIAIGAPTQNLGVSKEMKVFLKDLLISDCKNKYFFTFDTRNKMFFNNSKWKKLENSASKYIESYLIDMNCRIIKERVSAIVEGREGPLIAGTIENFIHIGEEISSLLKTELYTRKGV